MPYDRTKQGIPSLFACVFDIGLSDAFWVDCAGLSDQLGSMTLRNDETHKQVPPDGLFEEYRLLTDVAHHTAVFSQIHRSDILAIEGDAS
jgi:hypothetical protein